MKLRTKLLVLLALALAIGSAGYSLWGSGNNKQVQLQTELEKIQAENESLKEENHKLALEVEALQKNRDYQEKAVRDELGLVKKDEMIFHLSPATDKKQPGTRP